MSIGSTDRPGPSGYDLRDAQGRRIWTLKTEDAALDPTDRPTITGVYDADGREHVVIDGVGGGNGVPVDFSKLAIFAVEDYGNLATAPIAAYEAAHAAAAAAGGGILQWPAGDFTAEKQTYLASGWGSILAVTHSNIYVRGAGKGATIIRSGFTGAGTCLDFLGYAANTPANNWATVRFNNTPIDPLVSTDVYNQGDQVLTLATAGHAANYQAGDIIMVATGQIDLVAPAARGWQPDGCLREIASVNTGTNQITLKRGLPKPMRQEYFADGTSSLSSTLTSSAFPAPYGIYQLRNTSIRNCGVSDITFVCAATSRPALAAHSVKGLLVDNVELLSANGGGLATYVMQEVTEVKIRNCNMECSGTPGYWGFAMCSDDISIEEQLYVHKTDVAVALNNEGVANVRMRNITQVSAKGAATGASVFSAGARSYNMDVDGLTIVNASSANAIAVIENQPAPYYAGNGRLNRVRIYGTVPNVGYVRANWTVTDCPASLRLYGPPDDASLGASTAVPSSNSTRQPTRMLYLHGRFPYNQATGKLYLGRIPLQSWIFPPTMSIGTAFTAGTTVSIGVTDPTTGTDFDNFLVDGQAADVAADVTCTFAAGRRGVQTTAIEYDVYVKVKAGTPAAGVMYVCVPYLEKTVRAT